MTTTQCTFKLLPIIPIHYMSFLHNHTLNFSTNRWQHREGSLFTYSTYIAQDSLCHENVAGMKQIHHFLLFSNESILLHHETLG